MSRYTATDVFHYPDGVLLPGETADLSDADAQRGLALGVIGPEQTTAPTAPPADPVIEQEPDPVTPPAAPVAPSSTPQE